MPNDQETYQLTRRYLRLEQSQKPRSWTITLSDRDRKKLFQNNNITIEGQNNDISEQPQI